MTETQQNKVTKTLVDGVVNNPLGSIEQQKALAELAKMTELDMNQAKNLMDKEVKEMHESNELWLKKRELEIREKNWSSRVESFTTNYSPSKIGTQKKASNRQTHSILRKSETKHKEKYPYGMQSEKSLRQ